uniref:hypothetical protein n=1 Tax=Brevundimonas sp. TaxID=1871086 RepID=UPI00289CD537
HVTLTAPLWSGGVRFQGYASAAPAPAFVASVPDPGVQFQIDGVPEIAVHVRHEGQVLEVFSHDDFIALPAGTFDSLDDRQVLPIAELDFEPDLLALAAIRTSTVPVVLIEGAIPLLRDSEPDYWLHG